MPKSRTKAKGKAAKKSGGAHMLFCPGCSNRCWKGRKRLIQHYYNKCEGARGGTAVAKEVQRRSK